MNKCFHTKGFHRLAGRQWRVNGDSKKRDTGTLPQQQRRYAAVGKLAEIAEHLMKAGLRGADLARELKGCARRDDLFCDAGSVNQALAIAEQRIEGAPAALVAW
jgi:hypothetical protein